jgi:hypothetical protein
MCGLTSLVGTHESSIGLTKLRWGILIPHRTLGGQLPHKCEMENLNDPSHLVVFVNSPSHVDGYVNVIDVIGVNTWFLNRVHQN